MIKLRIWIFSILLGMVIVITGHADDPFSLQFTPGGAFPLGHSTELYSFGGSALFTGTYRLPFFPLFFAQVTAGYTFAQTTTASTLTLIPIGLGAGIDFQLIPPINLRISTYGGYYIGMFQTVVGGNLFFGAEGFLSLNVIPAVSIGAGVSYAHYHAAPNPLFQALGVAIEVKYHIGAAPRPAKIEIEPVEFPPVFPIFYTYYDEHPVGKVLLANREKSSITDLSVSFYVDQYMSKPKLSATIPELKKDEEIEISVFALFTDQILKLTEDTKVQAVIQIEYSFAGNQFQSEKVETIRLHHRNAMTWDDDRKAAAFVTAKDPSVLRFSKNVVGVVRNVSRMALNSNFRKALGLFEALSLHGMSYVVDPTTPYIEYSKDHFALDYLAFPRQSLEYRAGDCDDLSILYTALLQSVGIESAFITVPEHIYTAFSLGIEPAVAERTFLRPDDLIFIEGETWVPVEITLVGEGFLNAWQVGSRQWRENVKKGAAAFFPIQEAWQDYEPVGLPGDAERIDLPHISEIETLYTSELDKFIQREITPKVNELKESIKRNNNSPKEINKLGVLYARFGLFEQAEEEFNRILANQEYVPALINLANVYYIQGFIDDALEYYNRALKISPENGAVLLGVAKANYEKGNHGLVKNLYNKLAQIRPSLAERYSYLVVKEDDTARASETVREDVWWEEEE